MKTVPILSHTLSIRIKSLLHQIGGTSNVKQVASKAKGVLNKTQRGAAVSPQRAGKEDGVIVDVIQGGYMGRHQRTTRIVEMIPDCSRWALMQINKIVLLHASHLRRHPRFVRASSCAMIGACYSQFAFNGVTTSRYRMV